MSGLGESVFLEGMEKGIEQGVIKERREFIVRLSKKMDITQIAEVTELPIEEIKEILNQQI